jgi:hypothetical protein
MSACWFCYWGWPKQIADIYDEAVELLGDYLLLEYGPAHIVWGDENFDSAQWCLDHFEDYDRDYWERTQDELDIIKWSLIELLKLPNHLLTIDQHSGYTWNSDSKVEDCPPPDDVVMVKR